MAKKNNFVFKFLSIVAWVIFIGLCIEAVGLIVNLLIGLLKPEIVHRLYNHLDLSEMYNRSQWVYFSMYSIIIVISVLKAYLFYVVIKLITKLDLSNPFNSFVSEQISKISYYTLSIGLLSFLGRQSAKNLLHRGYQIDQLNQFWVDSEAFILMAAVVYIIAQIFKRGIELQSENELTI